MKKQIFLSTILILCMGVLLTACDTGSNNAPVINANTIDVNSYSLADKSNAQENDQENNQDDNMVVVPTSDIHVISPAAGNMQAENDNPPQEYFTKPIHHVRTHHAHHVTVDESANVDASSLQDINKQMEQRHEVHHVKLQHSENLKKTKLETDKSLIQQATWPWPAQGSLLKEFSEGHPGIEIQGDLGESINAVAAGTVIYSQANVNRYGNMIIIDHGNHLLSAYAYNASLLVHPGEQVIAGQKIATMGKDPDNKASLYFEVRRNGKPVNPLAYLSKKS